MDWNSLVVGLVSGGALGTFGTWIFTKIQNAADCAIENSKNKSLRQRAEDAYEDAVSGLKSKVDLLKSKDQWGEQTEETVREEAIINAEATMDRVVYDWINLSKANPDAWKKTLVDHLVQELK